MAWKSAIDRPNCLRSCEYLSDASSAACAIPRDIAPIEMRPPSRVFMNCLNPSPSGPKRLPCGSFTFSKISSTVSLARCPSFFSRVPGVNPGVPRSMMKELIPFTPTPGVVTAVKTVVPETEPFVM